MRVSDTVEFVGKSLVQHGPLNRRIYVLDLDPWEISCTLRTLDSLAGEKGYSKIIVKVPEQSLDFFRGNGYIVEAEIPGFFSGVTRAYFMAKFLDPERQAVPDRDRIDSVLASCRAAEPSEERRDLPAGMEILKSRPEDAEQLAALYLEVFSTYPFPIGDPGFLRQGMEADTRYFHVTCRGTVIAASSFEFSRLAGTAEMTDFAVLPEYRGSGLSGFLLRRMEREAQQTGILLAYTIARAVNLPVNRLFAGAGYRYAGLLAGNTNICGSFESMNVWYKRFSSPSDQSAEVNA